MPTPATAARQCLTDEAARVLDDAINVARRRTHAQTTSLHAVSALLALPSSVLREACSRARSCSYSPRLQFRALELSVSVSLDRLPTAKSLDEPPISNSLMAAIKRSQANQRRHPDTFHLYQQLQNQGSCSSSSISTLKVELKHFVLSILDDPIVSRVLGEAGFRSYDIKLVILNPPTISRLSANPHPPLFFCNSTDYYELNRRPFNFPFSTFSGNENVDENSRRISEVLVRKSSRNPLLIGAFANDALRYFTECVEKGDDSALPYEINGLSIICIGKEISEFLGTCESEKRMMDLKFKELSDAVEGCTGPGMVVNYGELKVFVDGERTEAVKYVVYELKRLVEVHSGKLRLVGSAGSDESYIKFLGRFPSIQKDWDLHLLPITTSASITRRFNPRSSLMGSFVPFAGFFPTPSEFENVQSNINQSIARCNLCNEKYEQEVTSLLKGSTTTSVADQHPSNVPPWLQMAECGTSGTMTGIEAKNDNVFNIRVVGLQKKWNDICQHLHQSRSSPPHVLPAAMGECKSQDSVLLAESQFSEQNISPSSKQELPKPMVCTVSTDLGLGTIYVSTDKRKPEESVKDHKDRLQNISGSVSCCRLLPHVVGDGLASKDFKYIHKSLAEIVYWQDEAIYAISQIVSSCINGQVRGHGRNRGNIWLSFLGADTVGKRKIVRFLSEKVFGSQGSLLFVDLSSNHNEINNSSNSMFDHCGFKSHDVSIRGKAAVDCIADELSKKCYSAVLLENIEKSDFLIQNSLSQSLKTGKFPDLHGREISINNTVFMITSKYSKDKRNCLTGSDSPLFSERSVLAAKDLPMRIIMGPRTRGGLKMESMNVFIITSRNKTPNTLSLNKRKLMYSNKVTCQSSKRASKVSLDLNLPVEEEVEEEDDSDNSNSDSGYDSATAEWLDDFLKQTDENVIFKPFDFDAVAKEILKGINNKLVEVFGTNAVLEIDQELMIQMLAAAWLSDRKEAVDEWIKEVMGRSFLEAQTRFHFTADINAIKFVAFEGIPVEPHSCGIRLPARVCVM
ncbi:unnamed protein product [Cuscuta epithymum]|uniref:Clp R domain-containing protein n=2 Tax=Cuscuta epithymum TaxID=186058 RepID=A0AAV0EB54_9ASTE|nr:unnamed protein product [Cuscuta epithymum]